MRTVTTILYTFEELSEQAQKKAIEDHRYINVDNDHWYEWIIDNFKEKLEKLGYTNPEVEFTGFGSQGDGACYTSGFDNSTENLYRLLPQLKNVRPIIFELIQDLSEFYLKKRTYQYSHEFTVSIDYTIDLNDYFIERYPRMNRLVMDLLDELDRAMNRERVALCRELYSELQDQYFTLMDDNEVAQSLIELEFEFEDYNR